MELQKLKRKLKNFEYDTPTTTALLVHLGVTEVELETIMNMSPEHNKLITTTINNLKLKLETMIFDNSIKGDVGKYLLDTYFGNITTHNARTLDLKAKELTVDMGTNLAKWILELPPEILEEFN